MLICDWTETIWTPAGNSNRRRPAALAPGQAPQRCAERKSIEASMNERPQDCRMKLKQLIENLPNASIEGSTDGDIAGITCDSRRVREGMIFVAVKGQQLDGHDYILNAIERGAAAIICEQNGIGFKHATKIKVPDAREAMAIAATTYYENPSAKLRMIGVTGTNGKTTVAFMVKHLLETSGIKAGLIGTIRYEVGDRIFPAQRTTPDSLEIQKMLAGMVRAGCEACVMEVSSHALEQKRVHGIEFDVTIFTNLTRDHLDYHGSEENYYQAKRRLFTPASRSGKRSCAIINIDDPFGRRLTQESSVEVQLTYGLSDEAKFRATHLRLGRDCTEMVVETPEFHFPCRLPLLGRHNVCNALAAAGAASVLEVGPAALRAALNTMEPVPGRLERVSAGQPFGVFVDYAHTDDALRNVLTTVREFTPGRLLLLFGCGGSRDSGKRARMGKVAAELADFTFVTNDNPRKEAPEKIAAQIEEGFRSVRSDGERTELDRQRAIGEIIRMARPEDNVLIAGKGHETYQEFEDTLVPFDDRVYARETLETLGWKSAVSTT